MSKPGIFFAALHEKTGAELLNETSNERQLRFMMRVRRGPTTTLWLGVIDHLIMLGDQQLSTQKPEWTIDISKQYFRRPELKYGWRIILQGQELASHYEMLANEVRGVQVQAAQITEVRLYGSPNRKSGGLYGQVLVGPLALAAKQS